jgi:hypothetical protein
LHYQDVPFIARGEIVASALAVAGDCEKRGRRGLWRHYAGGIGNGLRVDPVLQPDGEILRFEIDRGVRGILQFNAKDERILLFEAPHITDPQLEIVIVVGRVWRGVENALERVWIILLEKRISFRLVEERK